MCLFCSLPCLWYPEEYVAHSMLSIHICGMKELGNWNRALYQYRLFHASFLSASPHILICHLPTHFIEFLIFHPWILLYAFLTNKKICFLYNYHTTTTLNKNSLYLLIPGPWLSQKCLHTIGLFQSRSTHCISLIWLKSPTVLLLFNAIYLMKKLGHLYYGISHIMDLANCFLMALNLLLYPELPWSDLGSHFGGFVLYCLGVLRGRTLPRWYGILPMALHEEAHNNVCFSWWC